LTGKQAVEWGLATESAPADNLDEKFEYLLQRVAKLPINQLIMMKLSINQTLIAQGLHASQMLGTLFDGVARHTKEGYAFQQRAGEVGFKQAVKERDEPFPGGVE
jgi:enoyl-CoA hydratase